MGKELMAYGGKPTWEYIFPAVAVVALIYWEPGFLRDAWLVLGGLWAGLLAAWHFGWRKVK